MNKTSDPLAARRANRIRNGVTALLALLILIPSLWGFGSKFLEFIAIYRGDVDGAFAVAPILNYLFASLGFLLLFCWAVLNGMFHDIERPKYTMLQIDEKFEKQSRQAGAGN